MMMDVQAGAVIGKAERNFFLFYILRDSSYEKQGCGVVELGFKPFKSKSPRLQGNWMLDVY
jgi:hypothetical protein